MTRSSIFCKKRAWRNEEKSTMTRPLKWRTGKGQHCHCKTNLMHVRPLCRKASVRPTTASHCQFEKLSFSHECYNCGFPHAARNCRSVALLCRSGPCHTTHKNINLLSSHRRSYIFLGFCLENVWHRPLWLQKLDRKQSQRPVIMWTHNQLQCKRCIKCKKLKNSIFIQHKRIINLPTQVLCCHC